MSKYGKAFAERNRVTIAVIGLASLVILFGWPRLRDRTIPANERAPFRPKQEARGQSGGCQGRRPGAMHCPRVARTREGRRWRRIHEHGFLGALPVGAPSP